jgi:hypothetical protein
MSTMSPELALVDPELRADAVARLPPIYVNTFLDFPPFPVACKPPLRASAALAYLAVAIVRTLAFDAGVFAVVAAVVLIASLLG